MPALSNARPRAAMDMTHGPMLGNILRFALPLAASSLLQLLFTAADQIVVGQFAGSTALAAVGSNTALINMLVNFFVGFSIGANVTAARYFGARDDTGVHRTVHTSMLLSLVCGLVLLGVGVCSAHTLLIWMGAPAEVLEPATLYLRIYFLGMPVTMLYNFGAALLRSVGDTRRPLYCLTLAGVINVLLNLFFVIVCGMGVAGVAIATILSQTVSAGMVLWILMHEQGALRLEIRKLRFWGEPLGHILRIGLPAGSQSVIFNVANVVVQATINSFGAAAVAGAAAAGSVEGFVYAVMDAFAQTCVTFMSQNLGAGQYKRINRVLFACESCAISAGLVLGIGVFLNARFFLGLYSGDPAVIDAGVARMAAVCSTYALCGLMDTSSNAMRGIGYSVLPTLVSLCGSCVLRLLWVAFIFPLHPTILFLYLVFPLSWGLTGLLQLTCFFALQPRVRARMEQAAQKHALQEPAG